MSFSRTVRSQNDIGTGSWRSAGQCTGHARGHTVSTGTCCCGRYGNQEKGDEEDDSPHWRGFHQ